MVRGVVGLATRAASRGWRRGRGRSAVVAGAGACAGPVSLAGTATRPESRPYGAPVTGQRYATPTCHRLALRARTAPSRAARADALDAAGAVAPPTPPPPPAPPRR